MIKSLFQRPLTDYVRVQRLLSRLKRNSKFQLSKELDHKKYLDVGCGPNPHKEFVNLDYSWNPAIDICWDITKGPLPFSDNRFDGIYSEHCLEHLSLDEGKKVLLELYRILKPKGIVRLIVPDGELYLDAYQKKKLGEDVNMPYEEGHISPISRINEIFRRHGHLFIYDFYTLNLLLQETGFKNIKRQSFNIGTNKDLILDTEGRAIESLYIEAEK